MRSDINNVPVSRSQVIRSGPMLHPSPPLDTALTLRRNPRPAPAALGHSCSPPRPSRGVSRVETPRRRAGRDGRARLLELGCSSSSRIRRSGGGRRAGREGERAAGLAGARHGVLPPLMAIGRGSFTGLFVHAGVGRGMTSRIRTRTLCLRSGSGIDVRQ